MKVLALLIAVGVVASAVGAIPNVLAVKVSFNLGEEDTNMFTDKVDYEVEDFVLTTTALEASLCPTGSTCTYELEDAEFRENTYGNSYVLEGTLRVKTSLGDGSTSSDNYDLYGDLDREKTVERDGEIITEHISGDVRIDHDYAPVNFSPDYKMHVFGDANIEEHSVSLLGVLS